jgi:hypothetical protein
MYAEQPHEVSIKDLVSSEPIPVHHSGAVSNVNDREQLRVRVNGGV